MKKFVESEIATIKNMATVEIPEMLKKAETTSKDYDAKRVELNLHVIQALCGAEVVEPKKAGDQYKMKFCHTLPDKGQVAEIAGIINTYIGEVENPYFEQLNAAQAQAPTGGEDDMEIPDRGEVQLTACNNIPKIEKANNKKLKDYIFGYEGKTGFWQLALTGMDCVTIAALGEEVRKKANRNKMFLIGGIAILLTAGAVATLIICKKREEEEETTGETEVNIETSDDTVDIDSDEGTVDLDDAPTVEIE